MFNYSPERIEELLEFAEDRRIKWINGGGAKLERFMSKYVAANSAAVPTLTLAAVGLGDTHIIPVCTKILAYSAIKIVDAIAAHISPMTPDKALDTNALRVIGSSLIPFGQLVPRLLNKKFGATDGYEQPKFG